MRKLVVLAILFMALAAAQAQVRLSDAQITSRLIGCWKSPRHLYTFQCNGIMTRMCPSYPVPTTYTWAVRDGIFYLDSYPYRILAFDGSQFAYQEMSGGMVIFLFRVFDPLSSGGVVMRHLPEAPDCRQAERKPTALAVDARGT